MSHPVQAYKVTRSFRQETASSRIRFLLSNFVDCYVEHAYRARRMCVEYTTTQPQ